MEPGARAVPEPQSLPIQRDCVLEDRSGNQSAECRWGRRTTFAWCRSKRMASLQALRIAGSIDDLSPGSVRFIFSVTHVLAIVVAIAVVGQAAHYSPAAFVCPYTGSVMADCGHADDVANPEESSLTERCCCITVAAHVPELPAAESQANAVQHAFILLSSAASAADALPSDSGHAHRADTLDPPRPSRTYIVLRQLLI